MQMETFILGNLQTNCYLLSHKTKNQAVLIDPADDGDFLNEELLKRNLQLTAIVLTHGHFDHCLGLLSLYSAWPKVPIMLNFADQFLLQGAQASAKHWLKLQVDPVPAANFDLVNKKTITLLDNEFRVIQTPGHTPGSICLLHQASKILFSGDTIFAHGQIGRTDFSYSNYHKMVASLAKLKKLAQAGEYSEVWPGHGEKYFV